MAEDSGEDLYGDIDETPVFPPPTAPANAAQAAPHRATGQSDVSHPRSLVEEVTFLQEKVGKLQGENEVLKRNMGTLYRTATEEIQRKDKEILRLTTELDRLNSEKR